MRCLTLTFPGDVTEGLEVEQFAPALYAVILGKAIKLSNYTTLPMFQGNPPDIVCEGESKRIMTAFPIEVATPSGNVFALAKPQKKNKNLILIRFNMGARVDEAMRANVWPDRGNPTVIAMTTNAIKVDTWPSWNMDCIWTCAPDDGFCVTGRSLRFHVINEKGTLVVTDPYIIKKGK